jgi:flagellar basal-body rod protein FlgB
MISGITSALSAVNAYGTKLDVTANNIANANTNRFQKSRVEFQEQAPTATGVEAIVEQVTSPRVRGAQVYPPASQPADPSADASNVDMGEEMMNLILTQRGFDANANVIQAQDETLGTLLSMMA